MSQAPQPGFGEFRWAPRVRPDLIRRLYQADAQGLHDTELIDEVGHAMLARCETIRTASERRCIHCHGLLEGQRTRDGVLHCPACGWSVRWKTFQQSYKKRRIHGSRALPAFLLFLEQYPRARAWAEKMREIDAVIHAVHESLGPNPWVAPAADNLIEGRVEDTLQLLDELASGDGTADIRQRQEVWAAKVEPFRRRMAKEWAKARQRGTTRD
jgi:hypothetical protein